MTEAAQYLAGEAVCDWLFAEAVRRIMMPGLLDWVYGPNALLARLSA